MTTTTAEAAETPRSPQPKRSFWKRRSFHIAEGLLIPVVLVLVWWLTTNSGTVNPLFLPSPAQVWTSLVGLSPRLPSAIFTTVSMTLTGFMLGTLSGILIGLLLAYSKHMRRLTGPIFDALRPVPVFALIPLFILWFGLGRPPQVILVAFGTFVVLVVSTLEAIRNVSPIYVKAALNLGAARAMVYRTVIVPSITPHLAGAVRVSAAASWGLGVAAEFIGAQDGLGYLMINRQTYLDTAGILVIVILYSLIAFLFDLLIRFLQRKVLRWTERDQVSAHVGSVLGVIQ